MGVEQPDTLHAMATQGKNFSNLSKFTTPELSTKREGAKPFDRNLQRRESFGLVSPPYQDASQFNFDQAYQDPQNLTNQLPQGATKGPQMATSTRSTPNGNGPSANGQPGKKVFRSEVHREPVRIPVKVLGADGTERMLPNNGPLDIEGMKKRMADQMASMGFGSGFGQNSFPSMDSIFNMGPVPMRKRSSGPEGQPTATNVPVDVQKPGGTANHRRTPPKTFAKPSQPVHVSQNVKNINQQSAKKPEDTASLETASEFDNGLGEQIKNSPPVARKNTPDVGEAALLAELSRAADEKNKMRNPSGDSNQEAEAKNHASEESTPKGREDEEAILSEKFLKLNQQILKISFDLCSI